MNFRGLFIICILFPLLFGSCGSGKVLVLTDPYWEEFANHSSQFYKTKRSWYFIKNGSIPEFKTYDGTSRDFSVWFKNILESGHYDSIVMTYPFMIHEQIIEDAGLEQVLLGGAVFFPDYDGYQVVSSHAASFRLAGSFLKERWVEENRIPVVILWKAPGQFETEYASLIKGWGDNRLILENNILILEENTSDIEGKLNSFYNKFDFNEGLWSLFAVSEPALSAIIDSWPENDTINAILAVPYHEYLPKNVTYIIKQDYDGMMKAASGILKSNKEEKMIPVESLFLVQ